MRTSTPGTVLLAVAAIAFAGGVSPASADAANARWCTAWGTVVDALSAPSEWAAAPTPPDAATQADATYRFVVRPTVSGAAVRLRFANTVQPSSLMGSQPVTFGHITVGVRQSVTNPDGTVTGAGLVPGTGQQVSFAGVPSVTVAAGSEVVSDPIRMPVTAGSDLAVSVYVPATTIPPAHPQSYVTQYVTPADAGDHAGDTSGAAFSQVQEPIYWLDGVDVLSTAPRGLLAIGDSIIDGDQGPTYTDDVGMDRYPTWPDFLTNRLATVPGPATAVVNEGLNGDKATGVLARLDHDVLAHPGITDVVVEIGTNDITSGRSAQTVIQNIQQIVAMLHQHGLRVMGATLVPRAGWVTDTAAQDAARDEVNSFIRTSPIFDDGVLDIAATVGQPGNDNLYRPQYDSGDHLHPNTAGYQAIAQAMPLDSLRS